MPRRTRTLLTIVAGGMCAGLLWAAHRPVGLIDARLGLFGNVRARSTAYERSPLAAGSGPRVGSRPRVSPTPLLPLGLGPQSYSMAAPEYLSDPATAQARSIAVGDVSGDGRDDLVFLSLRSAPNPADNRMEIYAAYQRDDGRLDPAVKIAESGNNLAVQLLISDLDHDGVGDIVTATVDGVLLLRSNSNGTFNPSTAFTGDPNDIIETDVDQDGNPDVLVDSGNTYATVVYGDGRGGIARVSTLPLPASATRAVGDVTGDGLQDLVLATIFNRPLQEVQVYPALPSGGYAAPIVFSRPIDANQTASLAIGDFNGDGRNDLALDEALDGANLHIYLQDAQGKLSSVFDIARARGAGALIAADLDRNGAMDLAIAHSGWGYVGYYLQADTGLAPEVLINANQYMGRWNYFASGDLNDDGCGDLVISRFSQSPVLLYGQGCPPVRMDAAVCRYPALPVGGPTPAAFPSVRSIGRGATADARFRRPPGIDQRLDRIPHR